MTTLTETQADSLSTGSEATTDSPATVEQLTQAIAGAWPPLDADERRLALAIYRALAQGSPVAPSDLVAPTGLSRPRVEASLDGWPGVYRNEEGRIVGFWGLALEQMPHRVEVGGREVHAWCAYDPLFIAPLLGEEARVRSADPITGEEISLTVDPQGLRQVDPPEAVVSFLAPAEPWDETVIQSFCHFVLYFASRGSGERWVADHPGTFLLTLEEAFEVSRRVNREVFGVEPGREAAAC